MITSIASNHNGTNSDKGGTGYAYHPPHQYIVKVHFDEIGTQTFEDRILRLISHEPLANDEKCDIILSPQRGRPRRERTTE